MARKYKKHILMDNYDVNGYLDDVREYARDNGYPDDEQSVFTEALRWIDDDACNDANDVIEALQAIGGYLLIVGSVGRWNGTHDAGSIYSAESAGDMIREALTDCGYARITDVNGHLQIKGSHHDGDVLFETYLLSERGYDIYDRWLYDYKDQRDEAEIYRCLLSCNVFTALPHLWRRINAEAIRR